MRYIDADKLEEWVYAFHLADAYWAIPMLKNAPTADVVPKSEFEQLKEYIDDLNDSKEHLCVMLEEARADVAREIFEEIETCLEYEYMSYLKAYDYTLLTRIEELKKKYTEK